MSEVLEQIKKLSDRLIAVEQEQRDLEASANTHEQQARADRSKRAELKKEAEGLRLQLAHAGVQKAANDTLAAAQSAKADAEKAREEAKADKQKQEAEFAEMKKRLDELLSKAEAAQAK